MDRGQLQSLAASTAEALLDSSAGPLVRVLTQRSRAPRLDFDVLHAFLFAAFRWVAADEDYCRLYCLPDRSSENEMRTRAAADAKHAAREHLEAELRRFGIHSWAHTDAVDARQRVRELLKHARTAEQELSAPSVSSRRRQRPSSSASPTSSQASSPGRQVNTRGRLRRPPSAASSPGSSPGRQPSSVPQQQYTPIRGVSPGKAMAEEAEVQLLKHQVRQLELRLQQLEQDMSVRVGQVSLLENSAGAPGGGCSAIKQLVHEAVSAAMRKQGIAASGAPQDHGMLQQASHPVGAGSQRQQQQIEGAACGTAKVRPSAGTASDSELLHWAATRIQAVHRGKINRSIGDE